jgi:hypothetical protein
MLFFKLSGKQEQPLSKIKNKNSDFSNFIILGEKKKVCTDFTQ